LTNILSFCIVAIWPLITHDGHIINIAAAAAADRTRFEPILFFAPVPNQLKVSSGVHRRCRHRHRHPFLKNGCCCFFPIVISSIKNDVLLQKENGRPPRLFREDGSFLFQSSRLRFRLKSY
jgi:hypothetical protein